MKNYYGILELNQKASGRDINHAYRQLSLKFHPDKNPDYNNPNELVKNQYFDVQEAHEVLSDIEYRKAYDFEYQLRYTSFTSQTFFSEQKEARETKYKDTLDNDYIKLERNWEEIFKDIAQRIEEMKYSAEVHNQWIEAERIQEELLNAYKFDCGDLGAELNVKLIQTLENNNSRTSWCVAELIKNGADVNIHNSKGEYLLLLATKIGDLKSLSLLIEAGAKSGLEDSLIEATYRSNVAITQCLINAKVYVNYYNKYFGFALDVAIKNKNAEITQHLIAAGADTRKYLDHPFLAQFKENPIKFALDNAFKVENAIRAISRMEGQIHLNLSDELDATNECLAKLEFSQSYENLNELCGIGEQMIAI